MKLTDDSSNDFTILHSPQEISAPAVAKQKQAVASVDSPQLHDRDWVPDVPETEVVVALHPHASDQLIHLLCVQRT